LSKPCGLLAVEDQLDAHVHVAAGGRVAVAVPALVADLVLDAELDRGAEVLAPLLDRPAWAPRRAIVKPCAALVRRDPELDPLGAAVLVLHQVLVGERRAVDRELMREGAKLGA